MKLKQAEAIVELLASYYIVASSSSKIRFPGDFARQLGHEIATSVTEPGTDLKQTIIVRWAWVSVMVALLVACEPTGPMPGSTLGGNVTDVPSNWEHIDDVEVVQLETRGRYSINLWGVVTNNQFYVASSRGDSARWAKAIAKDSAVRLRVGANIYELMAVKITEQSERLAVAERFHDKYDLEPETDFPDATLFRLDRL
jgi:hypothetical protein